MRLTVLGGCGAWPGGGRPCSGYLVEHEGFRLLLDPGYGVAVPLLAMLGPGGLDAVFVSHAHPDHCADLNPILRARALADGDFPPLQVYSQAPLPLDEHRIVDAVHDPHPVGEFETGPFRCRTVPLPHFVPNVGIRLTAGGRTLAFTGDTGPDPAVVGLARDADVFLAEATHLTGGSAYLTSAPEAGRQATEATVGHLVLTHLWPGTDEAAAREASAFTGPLDIATPGLVIDL